MHSFIFYLSFCKLCDTSFHNLDLKRCSGLLADEPEEEIYSAIIIRIVNVIYDLYQKSSLTSSWWWSTSLPGCLLTIPVIPVPDTKTKDILSDISMVLWIFPKEEKNIYLGKKNTRHKHWLPLGLWRSWVSLFLSLSLWYKMPPGLSGK